MAANQASPPPPTSSEAQQIMSDDIMKDINHELNPLSLRNKENWNLKIDQLIRLGQITGDLRGNKFYRPIGFIDGPIMKEINYILSDRGEPKWSLQDWYGHCEWLIANKMNNFYDENKQRNINEYIVNEYWRRHRQHVHYPRQRQRQQQQQTQATLPGNQINYAFNPHLSTTTTTTREPEDKQNTNNNQYPCTQNRNNLAPITETNEVEFAPKVPIPSIIPSNTARSTATLAATTTSKPSAVSPSTSFAAPQPNESQISNTKHTKKRRSKKRRSKSKSGNLSSKYPIHSIAEEDEDGDAAMEDITASSSVGGGGVGSGKGERGSGGAAATTSLSDNSLNTNYVDTESEVETGGHGFLDDDDDDDDYLFGTYPDDDQLDSMSIEDLCDALNFNIDTSKISNLTEAALVGSEQTPHTRPSFRSGFVINGRGKCNLPAINESHDFKPDTVFWIPSDCLHSFKSENNRLDILTFHPDSEFGPSHEQHPMMNNTIFEE